MGSAGSTFTEPINDVGRFSDKQRSIGCPNSKIKKFWKTLFSSCFETLKVDLEQNLDIEMKTSSHLTIAMKTGQRRSASGHLFWGYQCSKCSVYFIRIEVMHFLRSRCHFPKKDRKLDQRLRRRYWHFEALKGQLLMLKRI